MLAADSFATTFTWALILIAVCLIPALFLPRKKVAPPEPDTDSDENTAAPVMAGH
ncbi:hypothetical protein SAMN05216266_119116 [Amycolatopsis marina]|uniref:Uncharacterized protein n=1 Tax=Amycolatopsis marina TaxID=490629 RepID=A0A1I1C2J9_9PSEU|nr:hypothetical protein [Amycolatopsis marina]SFB56246.1 hypothetical protein SAMN05216266_119116 [Amycolatopsis marina]